MSEHDYNKEISKYELKLRRNHKINYYGWGIGLVSLPLIAITSKIELLLVVSCFFVVNITYLRGHFLRQELREWSEEKDKTGRKK